MREKNYCSVNYLGYSQKIHGFLCYMRYITNKKTRVETQKNGLKLRLPLWGISVKNDIGKMQLRKRVLKIRKSLDESQRKEKNERIKDEILSLPVYLTSRTVMVYLDYRDEVETTELIREMLKAGKRIAIPYCKDDRMIPCEIFNVDQDVHPGMFGIREPSTDTLKPVSPEEIDLVLAPGVAFDKEGHRIGYGKGFYDRFLPLLREDVCIAGLAFFCQVVDGFETEKHDVKMSLLVTENGILYPCIDN